MSGNGTGGGGRAQGTPVKEPRWRVVENDGDVVGVDEGDGVVGASRGVDLVSRRDEVVGVGRECRNAWNVEIQSGDCGAWCVAADVLFELGSEWG